MQHTKNLHSNNTHTTSIRTTHVHTNTTNNLLSHNTHNLLPNTTEIHPVLWEGDELTVENISKMRAGWYSDAHNCRHLIHSPPPIDPLYFIWLDAYESPAALASALEHPDRRVAAASEPARLHPYCPMFARKFPESVSRRVLHLLKQPPLRVVASNASEGVRLYNSVAAQQQA